jgi:hypothetical protein
LTFPLRLSTFYATFSVPVVIRVKQILAAESQTAETQNHTYTEILSTLPQPNVMDSSSMLGAKLFTKATLDSKTIDPTASFQDEKKV